MLKSVCGLNACQLNYGLRTQFLRNPDDTYCNASTN